MLLKGPIPVAEGNATIKDGSLVKNMQSILSDLKPEVAYFCADHGNGQTS